MKNYEALKELSKEELAGILAEISAKIAQKLVKKEYGHYLEVSNFDLADIERVINSWLEKENSE